MPPSRRKEAKDRVAARTREGNAARCGAHVSLRGKPRVGFRLIFSHNGIGNELNYLQGYSSRAAVQRRRILAHRSLSLEPRQFCDLPQGLPISLQRHPLTIFHTATCGWLMPLLILHPRWDDGVAERVQRELYPARAPAFQMPLSCAFAGAHAILCLLAGRHSTLSNSRTDPLRAARVVSYSVSLRILSRLLQTAAFSRSVGVRLQLDSQEHALSAARARARTTSRVYGIVRTVARVLEGDIFQRSSVIAPGRLLKARRYALSATSHNRHLTMDESPNAPSRRSPG
ncbi:hypothetical protein GY45DRAFT_564558 [Cubamyces sp. BRFM 1775]|nr:hypothetical protein GY45DRAFT_564558 [Cubamyces sp. BRFM 1775]